MMMVVMMKRRLLARQAASTFSYSRRLVLVKTKIPRKCAGLSLSLSLPLPLPLAQLRGTANIRAKNVVRGRRHLAGCKEFQKSKFLGTRYLILEREGVA